jgi:3-oxoacyl-[acyl-carrier-protein] synthase II
MPSTPQRIIPVIVGAGLVSALGDCLDSTWNALLAGRYIRNHSPAVFSEISDKPRIVQLAIAAATEAMRSAGEVASGSSARNAALIVGTSKGPAQAWLTPRTITPSLENIESRQSGRLELAGIAQVAAAVGDHFGICGPRLTLSAACASGLHALIRGAMMIQCGEIDAALVVGAEASLQEVFLASFQRLGLLADPAIGCRPMDKNRDGLLISEAAAAVWLVRSDATGIDNRKTAIAIDSMSMAADAHHLTGIDPAGITLRRVIDETLGSGGVDLVHVHATGTRANDEVELDAVDDALQSRDARAIAYSHKGALGHSLGASGLVSTVLAVKSHLSDVVPGNVRTTHPLPANNLTIAQAAIGQKVHRTLILAAGFGGPVSALCLTSH